LFSSLPDLKWVHPPDLNETFTLDGYRKQMEQATEESLHKLVEAIPTMPENAFDGLGLDAIRVRQLRIIDAMTLAERADPAILNSARRQRVAVSAGVSIREVDQLVEDFGNMRAILEEVRRLRKVRQDAN
jgi:signal recognition particle subunit SRP54